MSRTQRHHQRIIVAIFTALTCAVAPLGAEEIFTGEPISLELADAELEALLVEFSQLTGKVFAVEPNAAASGGLEQHVDAIYESTPWDEVLDEILARAGWAWTLEGDVLWIYEPGFSPGGDRNFTGEPVNLRLRDADIRLVMSTFSQITGFAIEVEPDVDSTVTVNLRQLPWDQVLDLILRVNGLGFSNDGDLITVYRTTIPGGKQLLPPGWDAAEHADRDVSSGPGPS